MNQYDVLTTRCFVQSRDIEAGNDGGVRSLAWRSACARRARVAVLALATAIVVSQWVRVFDDFAQDDFRLHWAFGQQVPWVVSICTRSATRRTRPSGGWSVPRFRCYRSGGPMWRRIPLVSFRYGGRPCAGSTDAAVAASWQGAALLVDCAGRALSSRFVIRELPECGQTCSWLPWPGRGLRSAGKVATPWGRVPGAADRMKRTQVAFCPVLHSQAAVENGRGNDGLHGAFFRGTDPLGRALPL